MAVKKEVTVLQRLTDWRAICYKSDPDMQKPEVVYKFSNGKVKYSTDRTESGVYKRS